GRAHPPPRPHPPTWPTPTWPTPTWPPTARAEAPLGASDKASAALVAAAIANLRNICFLLMRMPPGHSPLTRVNPARTRTGTALLIATRHRRRPCAGGEEIFGSGIPLNQKITAVRFELNKHS